MTPACGIREFVDDGWIDPDHASPLLLSVFLDKDFSFAVSSEADARAFVQFDPEHTVVRSVPDSSDWQVTRKAGTEIRAPRKAKLSRTVGGQIPTGFDPTVWGGIRGDPYAATAQGNVVAALAHWNCSLDAQRLPGQWVIVLSQSETRKHNRSAQPRQRGPRVSVKETRRQLRLAQYIKSPLAKPRWIPLWWRRRLPNRPLGGLHRQ